MNDGNALRDDSAEQETLVGQRFSVRPVSEGTPDTLIECSSCGLANRGTSKFCKKCGAPMTGPGGQPAIGLAGNALFGYAPQFGSPTPPSSPHQPLAGAPSVPEETIAFQPNVFTPPQPYAASIGSTDNSRQTTVNVVTILVTAVLIGGVIIYSKQADNASNSAGGANADRPVKTNRATPSYSSNASSSNTVTNSNDSSHSWVIGREGVLTENANIRSASNRTAQVIGTHYQGARVRVLEVDSYPTDDGYATWYRVQVLQDGCDSQGNLGCGNNWERDGYFGWMEAQREGWMNARLISIVGP
ncbi:MAG: hypothetical protein ACK4S4_01060 [Pyrinomonadaceae bacterium]